MLTLVGDLAFILMLVLFFSACTIGLLTAIGPKEGRMSPARKEATRIAYDKAEALALMRRALTCEDAAVLMREPELEEEAHAAYLDARKLYLSA